MMNRFPLFVLAVALLSVCSASSAQQNGNVSNLIEQLVFEHSKASDSPLISPMPDDDPEYKKQFDKCREAFRRLTELGETAFPFLVAHLNDKRASIHFRNHYLGHSVGDACHWNIYSQLTDHPKDYSSYGEGRKGRDGQRHTKPYWEGTPFDDAGGLKNWL